VTAKVSISTPLCSVEVEHDGTLAEAKRTAVSLHRKASRRAAGPVGPGFGFQSDRRPSRELYGTDADGK
jgi:hypothetical protein